MEVSYDENADVLYITFKEAEEVDTERREDDVLIRKDKETGDIIGYTVIGFKGREEVDLPEISGMPA